MTRFWQTGIGILAVVILVFGSADTMLGQKAKKGSATNSTQKALPVKAVQVEKANRKQCLKYPGVVITDNQSELSFRVSGKVEEVPIKVGQVLKKGQLIAQLEQSHFINAREQARAAKRQAKARMQDARSEYRRLKKLMSARDISKQKLQNAKTTAQSAEEDFHIAQRRLAEAERQLGYTTLKSPFGGIVASKKVHAFQTVEAGQPIALIVDPSDLLFRVQLPPSMLPLRNDLENFQCVFPALNGLKLEAKLHGLGPSALPPLRTFPLTVEIESAAKHPIMPGTEGILRITVASDAAKNRIRVPASAITSNHKGSPKVWIANPKSGRAQRRSVKLGEVQEGRVTVESGLSPGEWVITAGQSDLSSGRKVKIVKPMSGSSQ